MENITQCTECCGTGSNLYTNDDCSECHGTGILIPVNTQNASEYIAQVQDWLRVSNF